MKSLESASAAGRVLRLGEIIASAMERDERDRAAFVREACAGDAAMEAEALSLIEASSRAGGFLRQPDGRRDDSTVMPLVGVPPVAERPGGRIGRYRLLQQIGEGGFGVVFMAEQREPMQRLVAIKVIKLGMDTAQVVARFEAERQALAMMDHPGIARVLDGGATDSGRPYFVMELVRGDPISRFCRQSAMRTRERLELFAQVCRAVQHAHTKGIIHRDIKPSNVLVTVVDGHAQPKVIDFGIAKATSSRLTERTLFTEFRQMIGTPAYMSPEQAGNAGMDIDTRTDVYSLGVLLYELLTGQAPFDQERMRSASWVELQRMIREEEPPRPSTRLSALRGKQDSGAIGEAEPSRLAAVVRGDLDWIVMRCLEKDRTRRYETPEALARDIESHLAGEPVTAAPPSRGYRVRKFARRHRAGVVVAAIVATALVLGAAGTAIGLVQARRQRDLAQTRAAQNAQVVTFLSDMLKGAGPAVAQGRDTTVLMEIIESTIARLESGELQDQPAVEAELRHTIGNVLSVLRQDERAIAMHRRGLVLNVAAFGERSEQAALSMNELATALWRAEQYDEAEPLLRHSLEIRREVLGPDHEDVGRSLNNLAMQLQARGDLDGAETMLRDALALQRRVHGEHHEDVATALSNIALVLYDREDFAGAEAAADEALAINRRVMGPEDQRLTSSLNNLAWSRQARGDLAGAEPLFREVLSVYRTSHPAGHPSIASAAENLGLHVQQMDRHGDAIALLGEAAQIYRSRGDEGAPKVQRVLSARARSLLAESRFAEAEADAAECLSLRLRLFGTEHPLYWTRYEAMTLLGSALAGQGQYAGAAPLLSEAGEWMWSNLPPARPLSATAAGRVGATFGAIASMHDAWHAVDPGRGHDAEAARWRSRLAELGLQ